MSPGWGGWVQNCPQLRTTGLRLSALPLLLIIRPSPHNLPQGLHSSETPQQTSETLDRKKGNAV